MKKRIAGILTAAVHQVFQCYMIHHTFDSVVQLFPEDLGDAVLLTVTDGSVVVQTFHRGKTSFCEAEDHITLEDLMNWQSVKADEYII